MYNAADHDIDHATEEQLQAQWDREMYEAEMGTLESDPEPWWAEQERNFVGPVEPLDFAF